ncbi:MAG: cyclodeaminase/cyclohydrolase family protein [Methanobacteriota archaeon]|nr:MAG: cyclodeaminase/cyclohydrolase family protein [Euryarchaeota archaeon]
MGVGDNTLEQFLESLAAATPTPGGGSVAAFCGALSAALSRMVSNLAIGKEGYEPVQAELAELDRRGRDLQRKLLILMDDDAKAYDEVIASMRLPKGTGEERASRVRAMQEAYERATTVPLDTMQSCSEALALALVAAQKGNRNAITDAGVAALVAEAGLRSAALNVRINLAALKDNALRARVEERLEAILKEADTVGHEVIALVENRL